MKIRLTTVDTLTREVSTDEVKVFAELIDYWETGIKVADAIAAADEVETHLIAWCRNTEVHNTIVICAFSQPNANGGLIIASGFAEVIE